jgi:hypothetical protein
MKSAVLEMHFEIMQLLRAQHPTLTSKELPDVKDDQSFSEDPSTSKREIGEWVEENYPLGPQSE